VILVGDFNLPPTDVSWEVEGWLPLIRPPQKTVVGDSSLYDNIWMHAIYTYASEYKGDCGVLEFDKTMFGDTTEDIKQAIHQVSDHRPVWGLFSTAIDDDDEAYFNLDGIIV